MKLIESIEDNFQFERAFVAEESGEPVPRAIFGGKVCNIETKPGALSAGIAYCAPVDGTPLDDWPIGVVVEKETADNEPYQETMWNFTGNQRVVEAARKFQSLLESGSVRVGMEL